LGHSAIAVIAVLCLEMKKARPAVALGQALRTWLREDDKRARDAARKANVDYSTVWRLMNGKPRIRMSQAMRRLCSIAGLYEETARSEGGQGRNPIDEAVSSTWDGTREHALLISSAIRSLKGFQVTSHPLGGKVATRRRIR